MRRGNRSHRALSSLALAGVVTWTAACTGSPSPSSGPSPVRPTMVTPTPTTRVVTPTTPALAAVPAAARVHTKPGAQAFAEFYIGLLNKAWTAPDPDLLSPFSASTCKTCRAYISSAKEMVGEGSRYDGDPVKIISSTYLPESNVNQVWVRIINIQEPRRIVNGKGRTLRTVPRAPNQAELEVIWRPAGWKIAHVKDVQVKR